MNRTLHYILVFSVFIVGSLYFSSCKQADTTPPAISFVTSQLYDNTTTVYDDTTITHGTIFTIGVYAYKAGPDQILTSGKISRSINSLPDSTIQTMDIATEQFFQSYSYIAGDSGNTERYTFTLGQLNGLNTSKSLTITDR